MKHNILLQLIRLCKCNKCLKFKDMVKKGYLSKYL